MPTASKTAERVDPSVWRIVAVAIFGAFLAQIDATVVNLSLATLAVDLKTTLPTVAWVISGYLLAAALTLPINGWLVDRIGAKALYLWCFSAFTLASMLCGLAWSAASLIVFRLLQGMVGGLLAPMTQLMIARAAGGNMAKVMGFAAMPILLAPIMGPVIAGAILQHTSWRWLFFVNLPVGALAVLLAVLFLPPDRDPTARRGFDLLGFATLSPGLALFLYATDHLTDRRGAAALAVAAALLLAFLLEARRKGDRALIDVGLWRNRGFSASILTQFLTNGTTFAGQMLLPLYLIRACGRAPGTTGLLLLPLGLGMLCTYPWIGTLTKRWGIRGVSAGGALLAVLATAPLIYLARVNFSFAIFAPVLFLRGVGMSTIGIPSVSAAYATVPREQLPMASTALNVLQRLGGPVMTTLVATFLAWRLSRGAASPGPAFADSFALLLGLQLFVFAAALRLPAAIGGDRDAEVTGPE